MTLNNPIFMLVLIGTIWFVPGIIVRRIAEERFNKKKADDQAKAIAKLYPKEEKML